MVMMMELFLAYDLLFLVLDQLDLHNLDYLHILSFVGLAYSFLRLLFLDMLLEVAEQQNFHLDF
jgi:hypothetical protein